MVDKVFTMRIDEELLEQVRLSAECNKRSIAKEIEYILDFYFNKSDVVPVELPIEIWQRLLQTLDEYKSSQKK